MLTAVLTRAVCWHADSDTVSIGLPCRSFLVYVWLCRVYVRFQVLRSAIWCAAQWILKHTSFYVLFTAMQKNDVRNCLHGRNHTGFRIPRLAARNTCAVLDDTHWRQLSNRQLARDDAWDLLVVPPCVLLSTRTKPGCNGGEPGGRWDQRHGSSDSGPLIV